MNIIKEHIEYLKDNPNKYWFKKKLYGWGWTPATKEGWLVILIYLILILSFSLTIDKNSPPKEVFFTFILPIFLLTSLLIKICYKKGEKPGWSWGQKK